jgi:NADP-dependent aldehyde dehydrogenase
VIWVEMGSLNPVVFLPGAVAERAATLADDLTASVTGSAGQFCTKPGLVFFLADAAAQALVGRLRDAFMALEPQGLLGPGGRDRLVAAVAHLERAGARLISESGAPSPRPSPGGRGSRHGGCTHPPTLLEVSGAAFRAGSDPFLVEAFGNATLLVACADLDELLACVSQVRGSLGASLYAAHDGRDDAVFPRVAAALTARAGRIIENRMPTGLIVTAPMQHGGPWPSAAPPFFSAVGFPFTVLRFARRVCFDGWSQPRLPECLRDEPPPSRPWRFVNGAWQRS